MRMRLCSPAPSSREHASTEPSSRGGLAGGQAGGRRSLGGDAGAVYDVEGRFLGGALHGGRSLGRDVRGVQLDEADFSGATMTKTTFVTCRGEGVSFQRALLGQAVFVHGSLFPDADFSDATMEKANLRGTLLTGARFDRANLTGADLIGVRCLVGELRARFASRGHARPDGLEGASLRGANAMDALASKAKIARADFTGANLHRADLCAGGARRRDVVLGGQDRAGAGAPEGRASSNEQRRRGRRGCVVIGKDILAKNVAPAATGGVRDPRRCPRQGAARRANPASGPLPPRARRRGPGWGDVRGGALPGLDARRDPERVDLRGVRVSRQPVARRRFAPGHVLQSALPGASFESAKLIGASFVECDCDGARFTGAEAPIASWVKTSLLGASFERANLDRANILEAPADNAFFLGANLEKATLYRAESALGGPHGREPDLDDAGGDDARGEELPDQQALSDTVHEERAGWIPASRAPTSCSAISWGHLRGASFEDARAAQCFFGEASLGKVRFDRAVLVNAIFEKASAAEADSPAPSWKRRSSGARRSRARGSWTREVPGGGLLEREPLTAADHGAGLYRTRFHGANRGEAVLPKAAGWLGDDEERLAAETWQPRHGASSATTK